MSKANNMSQKRGRGTTDIPRSTVIQQQSIGDVLDRALTGIDNVILEASAYLQSTELTKRRRMEDTTSTTSTTTTGAGNAGQPHQSSTKEDLGKADMFSAILSLHLKAVAESVSALGLQLLPALHELSRRLLTLITAPLLSSAEVWETCAMVALYYGVGTVNIVREVVDFVLREPGVLLLDCPCVVHPELMAFVLLDPSSDSSATGTGASSGGSKERNKGSSGNKNTNNTNKAANNNNATQSNASSSSSSAFLSNPQNMAAVLSRTERKLRALRLMLSAAGEALDAATLFQFATRFGHEIIEDGIFPVIKGKEETDDVQLAMNAFQTGAKRLRWRVPSEWKGECILMLDALLSLIRPVDPDMLRCATTLVRSTYFTVQQGIVQLPTHLLHVCGAVVGETAPDEHVGAMALAAVTQLRRTLQLLRHPPLVPSHSTGGSAELVVEHRPQRRLFVDVPPPAPTPAVVQESLDNLTTATGQATLPLACSSPSHTITSTNTNAHTSASANTTMGTGNAASADSAVASTSILGGALHHHQPAYSPALAGKTTAASSITAASPSPTTTNTTTLATTTKPSAAAPSSTQTSHPPAAPARPNDNEEEDFPDIDLND